MAIETFKATSKIKEGLAVENTVRNFKITMDEPTSLGGTDTGMNPVEVMLCALGSCQAIVASAFAKAQGIDLQDFSVELEGDLDTDGFLKGKPGVRPGYQELRCKMFMKTDSDPEKVKEFQEFIESRCPVGDTIVKGTKVIMDPVVISE